LFESREPWIFLGLITVLIVLSAGLVWANYYFIRQTNLVGDFLVPWTGSNLLLKQGISPYSSATETDNKEPVIRGSQSDLSDNIENYFLYPLTSIIILGPFGLLEYAAAQTLWMTLLELSLIGLVFVSIKIAGWPEPFISRVVLTLFGLVWFFAAKAIILGESAPLEALFFVFALYLIIRKQDMAAGFFMALSTIKIDIGILLVLFVILWAISVRRRQIVYGYLTTITGLLMLTILFLPNWPLQLLWQLLDFFRQAELESLASAIAGLAPGINRSLNLVFEIIVFAYLIIEWALAWGKNERWFLWTTFMTITLVNLLAFQRVFMNYVLFLPVLIYIFAMVEDRWRKLGQFVTWLSITILAAGICVFLGSVSDRKLFISAIYLSLPVASLIALWWVRWWGINPPRLQLEQLGRLPG
jgi:hypothetical protein